MIIQIDRVEIIPLNIPLTEPFEISLETVTHAQNVFVKLYANEGMGIGESSPFQSILGESQQSQLVIAKHLAEALMLEPIASIEETINRMDQVVAFNHGIKSAFDMAIHDLWSQAEGIPLYRFLGGVNKKPLTTDMTLGIQPTSQMVDYAVEYVAQGFDALKIKVGKDSQKDIERIEHIRLKVGSEIKLRIDANQGWTPEEALNTLMQMVNFEVEHCEEPIARWNLLGQQNLTKQSPIQIMADESLFDHHDAQRLIDFKACDSFNIKLAKSGGIFKAQKILELAERNSIPCQVGCFSETRIGITALAHLCMASDQIRYYDMDSPLMLKDDPVEGGIQFIRQKEIIIAEDTPGLGVALDLSYIDPDQTIVVK